MAFTVSRVIPILRIYDEQRAKDFYIGYLGFAVDWEHRSDGAGPLYLFPSMGRCFVILRLRWFCSTFSFTGGRLWR